MSKPEDLIQQRVASYLKSAWYARWCVVAIVTASFWFIPQVNRGVIVALTLTATLYNLLVWAGNRRSMTFLTNRSLILLIDGIMALVLVVYSGAATSPYLFTLTFMVISGAYWYGVWAAIFIGAMQTMLLLIYYFIRSQGLIFPTDLIVRMLILITIGIYMSLLTTSERSERHQLIKLGTETEKERQQLLALINNIRDAVLVVDSNQTIIIYNRAATLLADHQAELHKQPLDKAIQFMDDSGQPAELNVKRSTAVFERKDLHLRAADNSLLSVTVSVAPYIVDRQNRGHVLIIRDITQDKAIDQEREEFIAVASHELRTPLTIAQGAVSMLLAPPYVPDNHDSVKLLNSTLRNLQQLSHIINDLTNLSEVENEKLEVELEPLNPIALVHEFQADYHDQAKTKGLKLHLKVDQALNSVTILTSQYVVREILNIFMTNALKFTDSGSITIAAIHPEDTGDGVTFSVSDTGIGIVQSDHQKVFEKFFQSEHYANRVHGGTGLGLYIAKRLAARLTARVWFDTELGAGSTFYLWVPPYSKHKEDRSKVAVAETKSFFDTV